MTRFDGRTRESRTFGEYLLCQCLLPASLLTKLEQTLLIGRIDAAVSGAPYRPVFLPGDRRPDGSSRSFGGFKEAQRLTYDLALHVRLPRMTAGVAKRKVREIEPWNTAMLDNVQRRSDNNSRNPVRFEVTTYQADSLMANRTKGT